MLLVPFQRPHAPSLVQRAERTATKEEEDLSCRECDAERKSGGGVRGMSRESRRRRGREARGDKCESGADEVK